MSIAELERAREHVNERKGSRTRGNGDVNRSNVVGDTAQRSLSWAVPFRVGNVAHYITKRLFNLDQAAHGHA